MPKFEAEFPIRRLAEALDVAGYEFDGELQDESVVMEVEVGLTRMLGALASMGYINRRKKQSPGGTPPVTVPVTHTITAVSPSTGTTAGGTTHTITGTGFISSAVVTMNGNNVTEAFVSSTSLTFTLPALSAGTYGVTVTQGGIGVTLASAIVVTAPPVVTFAITGVSPSTTTTAGGTTHTITGTGFASNAAVRVGGTNTTETFVNSTTLTFVMPIKSAGTYNLTVTQSGDTVTLSNAIIVSAPAPVVHTVTGVAPSTTSTAGGTVHTITGTNFTGAAVVTIEGGVATTETFVNSTTITFVMPAMALGTYDLIVTLGATAVTLSNALVVGVPSGGTHPNEPAGLTPYYTAAANNIVPFDTLPPTYAQSPDANGMQVWYSGDPVTDANNVANGFADALTVSIATDPGRSGNVLKFTYPINHPGGGSPSRMALTGSLGASRSRLYVHCFVKLADNWTNGGNAGTKWFFMQAGGTSTENHYVALSQGEAGDTPGGTAFNPWVQLQAAAGNRNIEQTNGDPTYVRGTWHEFEMYLVQNTPGSANGIAKVWVNGVQEINVSDVQYTELGATGSWSNLWMDPTYGGGVNACPVTTYFLMDDMYVSTGA